MANLIREIIAIKYGLLAVVVIIYSMTAEGIMALTLDVTPQFLAIMWSFFLNLFFFIPGIVICLLGVAGTPLSWPDLIMELIASYWPPGKSIFDFITGVFRLAIANLYSDNEPKEIEPPLNQRMSANDRESWVFINGIATTEELAMGNARQMYKMFRRPVTIAYNPANGILFDLIECVVYKTGAFEFGKKSERAPRDNLINILKRELKREDKKTVVLVAHSQGTIITGNAIEELFEDPEFAPLMKSKLEVYTFANCAHVMSSQKVRYLENIYNRRDVVAWLGQLFPFPNLWLTDERKPIRISGVALEEKTSWGHLLNCHYLLPMTRPTIFGTRRFNKSNLWKYSDGKYDAIVRKAE